MLSKVQLPMAPLLACPSQLEGHQLLSDAFTGDLSLGFLMNCFFFFFWPHLLILLGLNCLESTMERVEGH